jgi:[ribosomal protein S5]-alanine N-acetyltransferase
MNRPASSSDGVKLGAVVMVETERLLLRLLTPEDTEALAAVLSDPIAMRWYPRPFSRPEVEQWIARNRERYNDEGYGLWAMVLKQGGTMIGDCGLVLQDVDREGLVEVAYHVRRDHWGRGYATEAAQACMKYAFENLKVERVVSLIRPENQPSWRVAEKNGMKVWKQTVRAGYLHLVYAMRKEEWEASGERQENRMIG